MNIICVILAAGLGKRMNSPVPKVLHELNGIPMLQHVLNALSELEPLKIVIVAGKHFQEIKGSLKNVSNITFVQQKVAMGTGDALMKTRPALRGFKGTIVVVNGDSPLITPETLKKFLTRHNKKKSKISILSFMAHNPSSYGRIVRDEKGDILSIVEDRNATNIQKEIKEVNSGVYAIESDALRFLKEIKLNESKGEYYLTDLVGIARDKRIKGVAYCIGYEDELMGVNTQEEFEKVKLLMKQRIINRWVRKGVFLIDPHSVFISSDVRIKKGAVIYPNVHLEGTTKIGKGCIIYPNVRIRDSNIEDGAIIKDSTLIEGSVVKSRASVGPFAHLRPGSEIGKEVKIGNFVEVKKSSIGSRTKAAHLTYLGDAKIGKDVNIGAGTITCNYDGHRKHMTVIEDDVFIGSDSQLIAPLKIGKGAYIGAGSTITEDVPSMALGLGRARQVNIEGWVRKRKLRVKRKKLKVEGARKLRAKS